MLSVADFIKAKEMLPPKSYQVENLTVSITHDDFAMLKYAYTPEFGIRLTDEQEAA